MKKECEVARDLMPLVLDEVSSDGSKELVLEHVSGCPECDAYYEQLKKDVPAKTAQEVKSEHAVFAQAAAKLRRQKRLRTLRYVLLGVLIACAVLLGGLQGYRWLRTATRQIGLDEYGIVLSELRDGRVIVTADFKGSTAFCGTTIQAVDEIDGTTGEAVTVLYVGVEKYLLGNKMDRPMQNAATTRIPPDVLAGYAEIRRGTPENSVSLWNAGDPIAPASEEMEAYYGWIEIMDRLEERMREADDGKAGFINVEDSYRYSLMHTHWEALRTVVPEWQPWVLNRFEPLDEATLRWLLEGDEAQIPDENG